MQRLEVSGAVRPLQGSLGVKGLKKSEVRQIAMRQATFLSRDKTNKCTHVKRVYHQRVTIAVATIIRVTQRKVGIQKLCRNAQVNHSMLQRMKVATRALNISLSIIKSDKMQFF